MYPISDGARALFEAEQRQVLRITGTDGNGAALLLTERNVMQGGFSIDRYVCNGRRLEIGTAIASELNLELDNRHGDFNNVKFEGAVLKVEIGIFDWRDRNQALTYMPCGIYTCLEQPRALNTISIHALDNLILFDKEIVVPESPYGLIVDENGNYISDESGNHIAYADAFGTFPCTVQVLVEQCCAVCGVNLAEDISQRPNAQVMISNIPDTDEPLTYRALIQWAAGIMASNAYADWDGKLRFDWYENPTSYTMTTAQRFNSDLYENDIIISGVKLTDANNTTYLAGTNDYALDLTGNLLIDTSDIVGLTAILNGVYVKVHAYQYRPFSAAVVNAPYLWPMDRIVFTDKNGVNHVSLLSNVHFGINGVTQLSATGETGETNKYASLGSFTRRQKQALQRIAQINENHLNEAVENATAQITGANGSQIQFIYDENKVMKEIVIMNSTDTATATKVWRWNGGGLGFSPNGYNGPYTVAITQDGSIVADFITAGTLDAALATIINLNASNITTGTLDGNNVSAKNISIKDSDGNVIATFTGTIQLGKSNETHVVVANNAMTMYDLNGDLILSLGDARDAQGYSTQTYDMVTADTPESVFTVDYPIQSIVSIQVDGSTISSTDYSWSGSTVTLVNPVPAYGEIVIKYKADAPFYHYELGTRTAGSEVGWYSYVLGEDCAAPNDHCLAFGCYNSPGSRYLLECVGNGSVSNRSNARTLDISGNEWIAGTLTQASDARYKAETRDVPDVSGIRARVFRWNGVKPNGDSREHIGYYAQDVEAVESCLVTEDDMGFKSLDYIGLLCAKIEGLERRVAELERRN